MAEGNIFKRLLTEKEVAQLLAVSASWLQKARVYGGGPKFIKLRKPSGAVRYRPEDIEAWLADHSLEPGASE
jgi:predicted DNA-binding transcriptional regulator AlpA